MAMERPSPLPFAPRPAGAGACPSCGHENDPSYRFCVQCGTALGAAPASGAGESAAGSDRSDRAHLVHLLATGEERWHALEEALIIGRTAGTLRLPDDPFMSGRHAALQETASGYVLRDLGSRNGTYVRVRQATELRPDDQLMMGEQVFRFSMDAAPPREVDGGAAGGPHTRPLGSPSGVRGPRLVRIEADGSEAESYALDGEQSVIGRDRGDIRFPEDGLLSGTHASVGRERGSGPYLVRDLGSRNGVYLRLRDEWTLKPEDQFVVGRQVFRFDLSRDQEQGVRG